MLNKKRLLIYTIFDRQDIISKYVSCVLQSMNSFVTDMIVVVNSLSGNVVGLDLLKFYTKNIIIRDNSGFDIQGYKVGLQTFDSSFYEEFDEIILMNDTLLGPIYPLDDMFNKMSNLEVDFWGLTLFHKTPFDPFGTIKYGYIPTHIQSSFMVFRKNFFMTKDFIEYWDNLPLFATYQEAVGMHEAIFTKHFEDLGYKWDVYVNTQNENTYTYYPLLHNPVKVLQDYKCPFIKRRSFFHNYNDYLEYTNGSQAKILLEFLQSQTTYNTDLIFDNIIRTCNIFDIFYSLNLNYISYDCGYKNITKKNAVYVYIHNENYINVIDKYICNLPEYVKINVILPPNLYSSCINFKYDNIFIGDEKDIFFNKDLQQDIMQNDIICIIHNKPKVNTYLKIGEETFLDINYQNLLTNIDYINKLFNENKYLGLLLPQDIYFGQYFYDSQDELSSEKYEKILDLKNKLALSCYIFDKKNHLHCGYGMFWCRTDALKNIFMNSISYDDIDLIKYILPVIVQGRVQYDMTGGGILQQRLAVMI